MKPIQRADWLRTIIEIVKQLDEASIEYQIDASTALFVHGIDFEMDDVDITVKWGQIKDAYELFQDYERSQLQSRTYPLQFDFQVDGKNVHVMSYRSESGVGEALDREQIMIDNYPVWSKTVAFYRRHMSPDHSLITIVDTYLAGFSGKA